MPERALPTAPAVKCRLRASKYNPPVVVASEAQMIALGRTAAAQAKPGLVVRLIGPLGAGKTTFARGFLLGLAFEDEVRSPTYNLIHEYPTTPPVCHADLYRLESREQVADLGLEDYLNSHVVLVEWAERAGDILPEDLPTIRFEINGETRELDVTGLEF